MLGMGSYAVTLTVGLGAVIDDALARDVAARWSHALGLELGMTSVARDEPWLRVSALADTHTGPARVLADAADVLDAELADAGHAVQMWHSAEALDDEEQHRRAQHRALPPMVNAQQFADLAGMSRQAIYQYKSARAAGRNLDFPEQVLDGYWLRSAAEHWQATRKRTPGPAPSGSSALRVRGASASVPVQRTA